MRLLPAAVFFLLLIESAALACSCAEPADVAEARKFAREVVRGAAAVVEVDVLSNYDSKRRTGEEVRVRRVLAGRAPNVFRLHRPAPPSSAACHLELERGQRRVLVVYPAPSGWWGGREYRTHGLCSDSLTRNPRFLAVLVEEARRRR
jgi:hypothetical protein